MTNNDWKNEAQRILRENFPEEEHDMIIYLMAQTQQNTVREVIESIEKKEKNTEIGNNCVQPKYYVESGWLERDKEYNRALEEIITQLREEYGIDSKE